MTPNTTVTLYATPFDISNKYVIAANSPGEALAIVSSYPSKVYTDCYWQRDNDFVFRANGNINEVEQYNYCVYLNNGRYNFAFITQCDYVNDAMTLVHLALDPWLNFAGQYTFNPSPMVRCHPAQDANYFNYFTEPYTVDRWLVDKKDFGKSSEYQTYKIFIVTKMPPSVYDNMSLGQLLQGVMDIANGNGTSNLLNVLNGFNGGSTLIQNLHPQAATSLYSMNSMQPVLKKILSVGRESDILGAYYVPECCLLDTSDGYKETINPWTDEITLTVPPIQTFPWRKMGYSEQFNQLYVNVCGAVTYIPYNQLKIFDQSSTQLRLHIAADPGLNGCIYCWFDSQYLDNAEAFQLHSKPWDTIQLSGYARNETALAYTGVQAVKSAYNTVTGAINTLTAPGLWGLPKMDIFGAVSELGQGALDQVGNVLNAHDILKSGGYAGGNTVSSMAAYNLNFPLVTMGRTHAFNLRKLQEMFGTYGYTMNGEIHPITFKNLPHWTYYQTQDAQITGAKVPQRYLSQMIQRFNSGIFVFNTTDDYKDLSAAAAYANHY